MHRDEFFIESLDTDSNELVFRLIASSFENGGREEIERLFRNGKIEDGVEMLLEKMLRFLAEIPVDKYHDYGEFRHKGLRSYLINRFMTEKWRTRARAPL